MSGDTTRGVIGVRILLPSGSVPRERILTLVVDFVVIKETNDGMVMLVTIVAVKSGSGQVDEWLLQSLS